MSLNYREKCIIKLHNNMLNACTTSILISDQLGIYFFSHINKKTTFTDPRLAFAYEEKKDGSGGIHGPKYDASSTAMQVVQDRDLTGQYAIITGANSGLGLYFTISPMVFQNLVPPPGRLCFWSCCLSVRVLKK